MRCTWNELLVIEHDLERLKETYNNATVFFEIMNHDAVIICWAFLKLFSPQFENISDKFQLQLFEYQKMKPKNFFSKLRRNKNQNEENIYEQWRLADRKKYKSTLIVTVKVLNKPQETEPMAVPVQHKISVESINRKWQKLPGQACKVPNKVFAKILHREKGSMNVKFSQDGNYVAFTEVTKDSSILHVQRFPEMQEVFRMMEHSDLIHDIDWLRVKNRGESTQFMLTASSDFTSIVWCLEESSYTYHILPHPSFVYASKFLQAESSSSMQVVTAGRDCIVRIWQNRKNFDGFELIQELKQPNSNKSSYITAIATRNADTFYTSSSQGDVVEWTLQVSKLYHLNRHFKLDELNGCLITGLELHPRGNKIFLRLQNFAIGDSMSSMIFVLGVPTGLITQKHHQEFVQNESQGKLKVTTCGTHLFASNGQCIRFYSLQNGNLTSSSRNFLPIRIPSDVKVSSIDYHPKDFFLACSLYGRNGGVVICSFEADPEEKDLFEKLKCESSLELRRSDTAKSSSTHFSDIIRKLDEVFLAPLGSDSSRRHTISSKNDHTNSFKNDFTNSSKNDRETSSKNDDNTFTVDSKRSRTYTVSQGPATYTIQRSQNNTYEVQRKDDSDEDDTTITESFN